MEDKYKYSGINDCHGNEIKSGDVVRVEGDSFAGHVYYSFKCAAFMVKVVKVGSAVEMKNPYQLTKFIKQRERAVGGLAEIITPSLSNVFDSIERCR